MKWNRVFQRFQSLPVLDATTLLTGVQDQPAGRVQISRWVRTGKMIPLKKGIYILAEPYRKIRPFELAIASYLTRPSYVSLEKALEYYDMIPEAVPLITSVTPARSGKFHSSLGTFDYRHIHQDLFWGYHSVTLEGQTAFVAWPEKALLDLIYLNRIRVTADYLAELRLQNAGRVNGRRLIEFTRRFGKPSIHKAARTIREYLLQLRKEEKPQ